MTAKYKYLGKEENLRVNVQQAIELIKAWQAFGLWGAVVDCLDIPDGVYSCPHKMGVRAVFGLLQNSEINEHLWAGRLNKAGVTMVRHGIHLANAGRERGDIQNLRKRLKVTDKKHFAAEFHSKS